MTRPLPQRRRSGDYQAAHGLIQTARGLCSDEAPHTEIDAMLSQAVDAVKDVEADRDRYIRLFNRLEAAVSHHYKAHDSGRYFADDPDVALWKARDKILKDACEGRG